MTFGKHNDMLALHTDTRTNKEDAETGLRLGSMYERFSQGTHRWCDDDGDISFPKTILQH